MAGAGFKDFTAGDILTATQVDEYLMQQTVMRFADSAARTTALSGVLAEGMLSYLNDTNTVQVYNGSAWVNVGGGSPLTTKGDVYTYSTTDARLAVGANDTVLTADSSTATGLKWATPSSGGLTQISSTTLSGASVTLSSIPSTYINLYLVIQNYKPVNDADGLFMRVNGETGTFYRTFDDRGNSLPANGTSVRISQEQDNGTATGLSAITIPSYANATTLKFWRSLSLTNNGTNPSTQIEFQSSIAVYYKTNAISSIELFSSTGNFTSGTAILYGEK